MYFTAMGGMSLRGFHFEMLALIRFILCSAKMLANQKIGAVEFCNLQFFFS
jgi:hypothetical protein